MDNIFVVLFLVSFTGLVVGLIRPRLISRIIKRGINRNRVALVFGGATLLTFILFGVTADPTNINTNAQNKNEASSQTNNAVANSNTAVANTNQPETVIVTITQPLPSAIIKAAQVELKGSVAPTDATVTVDGKEAVVSANGTFSKTVDLPTVGDVKIPVVATKGEQTATSTVYVIRVLSDEERQAEQDAAFDKTPAGKICQDHSSWTNDDCQKVLDKKVWIGMSYDMLVYERGKPSSTNPSNYGYGTQYQYCWYNLTPSCFYDNNEDGLLEAYN